MGALTMELEHNRELLSQAIVDVLASWPELHRQIFEMAHYQGSPVEGISGRLGVNASDVHRILEVCDRKLRASLRGFRDVRANIKEDHGPGGTGLSFGGCFS